MMAHRAEHGVATMCRVLGVSVSGYYARLARAPSVRELEDARLLEKIRGFHAASRGTYGARRVHVDLLEDGEKVGRDRVARLMRSAGLKGISPRKWTVTTRQDEGSGAAPDLVERRFEAEAPDELWVADITYVPTWEGFLYLSVVLDVWSRRVVSWAMARHLRTELVLQALNMALWQRKPDCVIHHSDQGGQYTSLAFGRRCGEAGVLPSMGSVGDAYVNAWAEAFFATLETDLLDRHSFRSPREARPVIFEYIEGWYAYSDP